MCSLLRTSALFGWLCLVSNLAFAHSFDERYDLPLPLNFFVWGGGLVVGLSFVWMIVASRRALPIADATKTIDIKHGFFVIVLRAMSLLLFSLSIAAALWGTGNPLMNLAPSFIWIIWWIGLSLVVAAVGNIWPLLDPWRTLFDLLNGAARVLGMKHGIAFNRTWPKALALYPALFFLLTWSWLEVVNPIALVPYKLGCVMLVWTAIQLMGMTIFGRDVWQSRADVFAVYFAMLGRLGRFKFEAVHTYSGFSFVGFILAMLSTVLFDGLLNSPAWTAIEAGLLQALPSALSTTPYLVGTLGMILLWLVFVCGYYVSCYAADTTATQQLADLLAPSLIPIAAAYLLAHNFSSLVIQGQNFMFLISDPFAWGWDLFGTRDFQPNIGLIDAKLTWYIAIFAIVAGHVWAIWLAHQAALRTTEKNAPGTQAAIDAVTLTFPLTILMVLFTMLSLIILAEPLTKT
jgi:hypothetical protein